MPAVEPKPPAHVSKLAEDCLRAVAERGLGHKISLGGALGLFHYLDYRRSDDVDAWWDESASAGDQAQVLAAVEEVLRPLGDVRKRTWGDVVSVELVQAGRTVFSFQVARRSARLEAPNTASWADLALDSLADLVASKMVALVERGAPRDFRDLHALCGAGLATPQQCWAWWRKRQELAGSEPDPARARLAVETHLARIAQHRPLAEIGDPAARAGAEQVRSWFSGEFFDALRG